MVRAMKRRDVVRLLTDQGCRLLRAGKGDHEVWICPCGNHRAVLVRDTEVSAGVLRSVVRSLACLREGWLQ
jgi:hypothetical protein